MNILNILNETFFNLDLKLKTVIDTLELNTSIGEWILNYKHYSAWLQRLENITIYGKVWLIIISVWKWQ